MYQITLISLLVLILATSRTEGIKKCCPEENLLSLNEKKCLNNVSISLECNGIRFPVWNESQLNGHDFWLMKNGTLIQKSDNSEIKYCQSYVDDDTLHVSSHIIYIVCYERTDAEIFDENKIKVGAILGYISVVFTVLTIIVYAIVPKLLDLQGICMLHSLIGLTAGYTFLGVIQLSELDQTTCSAMAFLTYFCILYLFFWLNALSFHIWRTTVKPRFSYWTSQWAIIYHIFAIGGTTFLLIFLLLAHYSTLEMWDNIRPAIGEEYCWFKSMRETMIFFYGPIAVLLFFNAFFYLWTVIVLCRQIENTQNKILKYRLKLCIRLFIIMGITWIFEIISAALKDPGMSLFGKIIFFLLDLFNLLQGFLIFLILVVFRKRVRRALASKNLCNIQFPNSWKYLEDEEMDSAEVGVDSIVAEYKGSHVEIKDKKIQKAPL